MKRRQFISLIGGAAAWPLAARAQQQRVLPVVGYISGRSPDTEQTFVAAFRQGLNEAGYVEGRNVAIEYRWADGEFDRLPKMAVELVRRPVNAIASLGNITALAAKAATRTIPIVFQTGADPVAMGLVASLNRPGGNLTGVTSLNLQLEPKRLELLRELAPKATVFGLLVNPANAAQTEVVSNGLEAAARERGLNLHIVRAMTERDLDMAFTNLVQLRAGGVVIAPDARLNIWTDHIVTLAARHSLPAVYPFHDNAAAGGLMSYGASLADQYRIVGVYTGRILKGEKPADLPVQQATKVELIVNFKTAKTLGLTVPPTLFALATEIIE